MNFKLELFIDAAVWLPAHLIPSIDLGNLIAFSICTTKEWVRESKEKGQRK